jgi:replicative DNA helicase
LKEELQRTGELENAGGAAYLASLTDGLPLAANIEHYVNIVREKATLRRLIQISSETMSRGYQSEDSPQEILSDVEQAIFQISSRQFRTGFQAIDVLVSEVYKQVEEVSNRKSLVTGIETGTELTR